MPAELNLLFSTPKKVTVSLRHEDGDDYTDTLNFKNPLKEADLGTYPRN